MRKTLIFACLLIATGAKAQVLHVNNSNGTYQAFDTKATERMTFNEEQRLVSIQLRDGDGIVTSRFNTEKVSSIAPTTDKATKLEYDLNPNVTFDATELNGYDEIVETIITDETNDESGDFVENYSTNRIITITFSETGVKTTSLPDGVTATIDGSHIIISSTSSKIGYQIKGTCSNGSLKIYSEKKFRLLFNGITLTNPNGPAINIQSGKTVYASIVNGTTNTLCDGATYSAPAVDINGEEEDQKGTLFSEGQLIFDGYTNGTGTLNVTSLGGHAISSDDYIRVRGGNINILAAAKDGFRTKEKFIVARTASFAPTITINATGNGIECTEGTLTIEAGKIDITSAGDAIKVEYEEPEADPTVIPDAYIKGGCIRITTTDEKSSAIQTTRNYTQTGGVIHAEVKGNGSKIINCDGEVLISGGKLTGLSHGTIATDATSAGGIKCNGNINITGGRIAIACSGKGSKGINCNSDVAIDGGDITLVSKGENHTDSADDKKSRAITTNGITINGGKLVASAYDHAISATEATITEGIVNAYSSNTTALSTDAVQSGGWLLTKDAE